MMKKIELIGKEVFLAGTTEKIGKTEAFRDECIDIVLNNGCPISAYYGTTDKQGEFYAYCRSTTRCGNRCLGMKNPGCRYNRDNTNRAGYYADLT